MQQTLFVRSGSFHGGDRAALMKSLSGNNFVQSFETYVCNHCAPNKVEHGVVLEDFCKSILPDRSCTDMTLPLYLRLRSAVTLIQMHSNASPLLAWDFRLIQSFYEKYMHNKSGARSQPLLNVEKVAYLIECMGQIAGDNCRATIMQSH